MSIESKAIGDGKPSVTPSLSALSAAAFETISGPMTPRHTEKTGIKPGTVALMIETLGKLTPIGDDEAELPPPPVLALTDGDVEELHRLSLDLAEAQRLAVAAEQRYAAALHQSKKLPYLLDQSGQKAARAINGDAGAKAEVKRLLAQIDEARLAESALKTLADELEEARRARDRAFGHLRTATVRAFARMRVRAARAYSEAVDNLRRATACLEVSIEMDHHTMEPIFSGWHTMFINRLVVPALPDNLRAGTNGIEQHATGSMLMTHSHGYYTAAQSAIRSRLKMQIAEACAPVGLNHTNVL